MKGTTQPRRKLYEQALMVRKVKSYLCSLTVIDCEGELDRLSNECEPSHGSTGVARRRAPSPSPSSLSSQSSVSDQHRISAPKFGELLNLFFSSDNVCICIYTADIFCLVKKTTRLGVLYIKN